MIQSEHPYTCVGSWIPRSRKGIEPTHYLLNKLTIRERNVLQKYVSGVEHCFKEYAPSKEKCMIADAVSHINPPLFSIDGRTKDERQTHSIFNQKRRRISVHAAIASGTNVYLNIHTDEDFVSCATSVHQRGVYALNDETVLYFAFPRLGVCVSLKPGDVLLFNPKEPHAVSSRIRDSDNVYCVSLYLKSRQMGLNDNSLELTHEEHLINEYITKEKQG